MTDQGEVLRLASLEEAPRLFQLILRRITWLEERGIRQWERDDYLTYYPLTYFQERARNGALYGLWRPDGAPNVVAVLSTIKDGKITFLAVCGKEAVAKGVKAGDIVKQVSAIAGGSGGGKPDSAMGGGKDPLMLDNALAMVDNVVSMKLGL